MKIIHELEFSRFTHKEMWKRYRPSNFIFHNFNLTKIWDFSKLFNPLCDKGQLIDHLKNLRVDFNFGSKYFCMLSDNFWNTGGDN